MKLFILLTILILSINTAFSVPSEVVREDKKFVAVLSPIGLEFKANSISLEGGLFLTPKSTLSFQLSYFPGVSSIGGDDDEYDDYSTDEAQDLWDEAGKGFAASINYKYFIGNTFYVRPSIYYRSQKIVISTSETFGGTFSKEAGTIHDSGLSLRIGNQWQWDYFTLGCDWVGVSHSLVSFERSGNLKDDHVISNLSLINFYVGASF